MKRIVHLDLKGAPLRVEYLEKVMVLMRTWGADGILLEWEDTFPYTGNLADIGSVTNSGGDNMYSMDEVMQILQMARDCEMEAIQLIQTIGHMEFVLKHQAFRDLRENERSPSVLCPTKPQSQALVREIIDQVLEAQPDAKYLHIGADEVWYWALCPTCREKAASHQYGNPSLYLDHVKDLVLYIKEKRPDIKVLMWDDMMRTMDPEMLKEYALGELVEPVFWHYNPSDSFNIKKELWDTYARLFPKLWGGSAFKGANGSSQILSPVTRYITNQEAWANQFKDYADRIKFQGIILTGWSRYDHYATLCELFPVSLPCLANCLRILCLAHGLPATKILNEVLPPEEWPGEELARCVHTFIFIRERCLSLLNSDLINTWLNPWQISHKYTIPVHVEGIAVATQQILTELSVLKTELSDRLIQITGERSRDEWLETHVEPLIAKLTRVYEVSRERSVSDASVKPT
ncbi:hexosaminidase D isoform X2 [Helicoverpa armigera]|uniref:hexosaminidase D isoform X2 n=1 Tax=Helicoverpa armigera TaxID=29058 RepID=UPI00211138DD|nr:hexosaminidase D isoform X2 [Helicoverpa armigera]